MAEAPAFLSGGGAMGALMRAHDWSTTPLGPPDTWPQSLRSTLSACLNSPLLGTILWGPELRMLYNDAYIPSMADRHPDALGRPVAEVWGPTWEQVAAPFHRAMATGEGFSQNDVELSMIRRGRPEITYWNFSAAPIRGEDGSIVGLLNQGVEITGQVLTERVLRASDERQRRLLQQMPGFVAVLTGPDHVYEYVNEAYVTISGPRDLLGRSVRAVFPELAGQGFYELLDEVYATGEPYAARAVPIRLAGERADRFIDMLYQPIKTEAGAVTGIFVGGYDVTEENRSTAALRDLNADLERQVTERSRERSRTWQVSTDLLGVANAQGFFVRTNPAWGTLLGWSEDELARTPFIDLVHPDDRIATSEAFRRLKAGDPVLRFENRYRTTGGDHRWLSWVSVPEDDLVYCSARDVSEDRETAATLHLYENIIQSGASPICAFDTEFRLIAFNQAHNDEFFRVQGRYTRIGDVFPDLFLPEQAALMRGLMTRALAGEAFMVVEEFGNPELGVPHWEITYTPLRDAAGTIIGAFHNAQDISGRLRAEIELRTAQEALRQAQKMEAVGQLTGGVAHDFNNLLTVIKSSTDLLKRPNLAEDRRARYIGAISDTVDRAAKLTGQLLAFARRQALRPEVFDASRSVQAIGEMVGTLTGARVEVAIRIGEEPCHVSADPSQFDTALVNMAVNARDAMDGEGRLTIMVEATTTVPALRSHRAQEGDFVRIALTDTGTGIPEDRIDRIFEPFFTTKGVGQGTGLGLSQVFGFAKQSGGEIQVESEVGRGTTFALYLPRVASGSASRGPAVTDEPAADGRGTCVLVVEDNRQVGTFSTQTLEELGYGTHWVVNAEEALAALAERPDAYDVVFSDVVMPGMNGVELGREIRRLYPGLPVILTSGYSHVLAKESDHGFELLQKPYSVEALSRVLRKAASRQRRGRTTAE